MKTRFHSLFLGAVTGGLAWFQLPGAGAAEPETSPGRAPAILAAETASVPAEVAGDAVETVPPTATEPAPEAAPAAAPRPRGIMTPDGVILNFREAPLEDVLNYLSEAAGYVIVLDTKVAGTVNVVSHQPLNADETVDLLNAILVEKGYTAIRSGRILKIVSRSDAPRRNLPVRTGADPAQIPAKDEVVTQIIPVRYADATRLIENLTPLLPEEAKLTANESSNAIVLTDTQTNIRRMAEIIKALDTSISSISTVKVFPLRYADATKVAEIVVELFKNEQSNSRGRSSGGFGAMMERFRMGGRGGDGGGGGGGATGDSEARQAASRVVAVADERTNSLVVSAPDELVPTIEQLVAEVDTNVTDLTEVRIFRLEHADATEMADLLMMLFSEDQSSSSNNSSSRGGFRPPFMMGGDRGSSRNSQNQNQSNRMLEQARVVAVGDPRTNSIVVTASHETMMQIAEMVGRLDADSSRKQRVYVYSLEHADVENVASILQGLFPSSTTSGSTSRTGSRTGTTGTASSRLIDRTSSGASIDPTLGGRNTGGGGSGGIGGR
ncbi:MAG: hypothetical protein H7A47_16710 [Verrucomicrobiales bacterium]|nr:hypothetical protein [Verrucomicrobiales bacterium]